MKIAGKSSLLGAGLAVLIVAAPIATLQADEEDAEDDSKRCLNARSIRRTEVIDDNHIVFEIQGRRLFLNVLPRSCKGLSQDRRFSYEISTRSLCARDKIRVLREAGNTVYEGKSCSLGRFEPVTVEELVDFERSRQQLPARQAVESAEVEEVVSDRPPPGEPARARRQ